MLALQGYYENGTLELFGEAPTKGTVFVIFTEDTSNEIAMKKIQSLTGGNHGWASEVDMIKDMADFRRERGIENNA